MKGQWIAMSVSIEQNELVWTVIIDRPEKKNAVDRDTADRLYEAFTAYEKDERARVAVLWGRGGTFCAGADLGSVARVSEGHGNRLDPDMTAPGPMGPSRMSLSKPVVAAVAGYAVAGGLELACWCDIRVVEETAVFGVYCRRFGVPLIDGGTQRLPRIVGQGRALDMILTGRSVEAQEAFEMGLANYVVQQGSAREEAERLAGKIAAFPQLCLRSDRQAVYSGLDQTLSDGMAEEFRLGFQVIQSGESSEGAQRFVDRER
jgi:enoyl-CoA hydratase